jgi:hypothetical protein
MRNKIAFVVPYFGKLPDYFPLFSNSVRNQPFDILFFTDIEEPPNAPNNIKWMKIGFDEIQNQFSKILGEELKPSKPYKLCDFKPSYGLVFNEQLEGYDFWGSLDIDTVVGNFSSFITDEILDSTDIYSGVKEYLSGSLHLIRNNEYCNNLFKNSRDWKKVFRSSEYIGFDECGGHFYAQLKAGKSIFELHTLVQSFTEVIFLEKSNGLKVLFTDTILEPKGLHPVKVEQNKICYHNKEYLLLHFIYFKVTYYFFLGSAPLPATYYVSSFGTFKKHPSTVNLLTSKNFWSGVANKIEKNRSGKSIGEGVLNLASLSIRAVNFIIRKAFSRNFL